MEDIHAEGGSEGIACEEGIGSVKLHSLSGDEKNTVGEAQGKVKFVCRDEYCLALSVRQPVEQAENAEPVREVEMGSRLVKQDERCLLRQCFGNQHPLALSVAQGIEHLGGVVRHAHLLQSLSDALLVLHGQSAEERGIGVPAHSHDIVDGGVLERKALGEDECHSARPFSARKSGEGSGAPQFGLQAGQSAQQRGFATTVRPQHTNHLPLIERESHALLHDMRAIADCKVIRGNTDAGHDEKQRLRFRKR